MAILRIDDFTDPGCPFAFSAEPARLRLSWLFGDQVEWRPRMIVLSRSPQEYLDKGFTPERQATALAELQRRYGMPIDPRERPRMPATVDACRAVVAARLYWPYREQALLRRLRIRAMAGDMLDAPFTIALAAREAGIADMPLLAMWGDDEAVERELEADAAAARRPSRAALALDHKLAPAGDGRRYTAPSYEIARLDGSARFDVPGFQPVEVYEAAIANLAPELARRAQPDSVEELLAWAGEPLATVEVATIMGIDRDDARTELARVAHEDAVGPDGWWTLDTDAAVRRAAA
jgi:predicted DsbA family dithiol-disulfide isomerase